jgi:hypothetical protein
VEVSHAGAWVRVGWQADADLVRRLLLGSRGRASRRLAGARAGGGAADLRGGLHFGLQVWSTQHLKGEGRLKSDLNFAAREKLAATASRSRDRRSADAAKRTAART